MNLLDLKSILSNLKLSCFNMAQNIDYPGDNFHAKVAPGCAAEVIANESKKRNSLATKGE